MNSIESLLKNGAEANVINTANYTKEFHQGRHVETSYSAKTILGHLLNEISPVNSAVDIGCGVGTFLAELKNRGVATIKGFDGPWVDKEMLVIPKECFCVEDLSKPKRTGEKFDLAVCLEVAEHLPRTSAKDFVNWLSSLSDSILFSAAIPFQGGINHVNEAWQSYWVDLFAANGFEVDDFIRGKIWNDDKIAFWYRQNILVFCKKGTRKISAGNNTSPINLVHPESYLSKCSQIKKVGIFDRVINRVTRMIKK